jgi:putative restriction endonuclease
VVNYWAKKSKAGFRIFQYELRAMPANEAKTFTVPKKLAAGSETPKRREQSTTRVIRDTQVSRDIKALHKHCCQVCGLALQTPTGLYAEAAHIRALGKPHFGPDTPDNVICLCPNHHLLFDRGTFSIADDLTLLGLEGKLRTHKSHTLSTEHLRYHREGYGFD